MKTLIRLFLLIAIAALPQACVHNDGNIGDWFGTWRLESIKINGTPDAGYNQYIIWKFQSDMVLMVEADDVLHEKDEHFGTWRQEGDILELNYSYNNEGSTVQAPTYTPPASTHLPAGISVLSIIKLSKGEIQLLYTSPETGDEYFYTLKKWG